MGDTPEQAMNRLFSKTAGFQRWLDVEAALARAQAGLGVIPKEAAEEITKKAKVDYLDLKKYDEIFQETQHPMVSLLRIFQPIIGGEAGQYIHLGATTQDIIDTGTVLAVKQAHQVVHDSLFKMEHDFLNMAEKHAETIMVGRTHSVQAQPITFGFKVVIWAREIRRCIQRLRECRTRVLVLQLSGAVGTLAALGSKGPEIQELVAKDLGLGVPDISWHASRDRLVEFCNILVLIAGCLGRIAQEVYLLMATEVGEVCEPWKMGVVGSSTMPHKINPEISQEMLSLARKIRYNAGYLTEVMVVDHERNLEHFVGEREHFEACCVNAGRLLSRAENMAGNMTVFPHRMEANLHLLKGLLLSEAVMIHLGKKIGKQLAHEIVYENASKSTMEQSNFKHNLLNDDRVRPHITEIEIDHLLDPKTYIGLAPQITREAVALSRKERGEV